MKSTKQDDELAARVVKAPTPVLKQTYSYGSSSSDEGLVRGSICPFEEEADNTELKRIKGTNICKIEKTV